MIGIWFSFLLTNGEFGVFAELWAAKAEESDVDCRGYTILNL